MPRYTRRRQTRKVKRNAVARVARAVVAQAYMRRNPVWSLKYGKKQKNGGFSLIRKLPVITLGSSAAGAGLATLTDPTGTCLAYNVLGLSPGTTNQYDVAFSLKFQLNQLLSFTDITQIADQYRINNVLVKLASAFQVSTGFGAAVPYVEYIQDHDDANVPTLSLMRTKMGVKTKYFGPTKTLIKMGVRPKTADEIYNNGVTTAYGVNNRQWINCDYPAAEHYAIKGILHNVPLTGVANQGLMNFDISFSVSAKDLQ